MSKLGKKQKTTLVFACIAVMLIVFGLILGDSGVIGNLVIISIFLVIIPFFFQKYSEMLWVRAVENQFPNLIRDLADSVRSGMSFEEAIRISTRGNYGKLTEEVRKMSNRLSWGTPFMRTIDIFGKRTKDSKLISEALNIIKESYVSGGNIAATLDSIARDIITFKEIEAEKGSMVKQHVMIMYGIFFMFLAIAVIIIFVMVPMMQSTPEDSSMSFGLQFTNPCQDVFIFPCDVFTFIGSVLFNMQSGIVLYYSAMFFTIVLIQGIFTGLIAGQLGENSVTAGVKHSIIMAIAAIGVFMFLAKAGLLPV